MGPCVLTFLILAVASTSALVCIPALCDGVKQESLNCAGSIIKGGGFCGCTDVCAKQIGERCGHTDLTVSHGHCEDGLKCVPNLNFLFGVGTCQGDTAHRAQRDIHPQSLCEKSRLHKLMMMVVYSGEWIPKCESDGSFSLHQCDNQGMCFCVDAKTGAVDSKTRVHGPADC